MKRFGRKTLSVLMALSMVMTLFVGVSMTAEAATVGDPSYKLKADADFKVGSFVYEYNIMDWGGDNTGNNDNTDVLQSIINKLYNLGGGTVYLPSGKYKFSGDITLKKGVTIRGDWTEPVKGKPIGGTIIMVYTGRGGNESSTRGFINMEQECAVYNLAFWYPEQNPSNIVSYSPTIKMGVAGFWGPEFNNVKDITFVNSYLGVLFYGGEAAPIINGVYGTTLKTAVDIDDIIDVGRVECMDLSPEYWIGSGLDNAPAKGTAAEQTVKNYIYNNSTGLVMRRNDWSYACYLNIEGYKEGYRADKSVNAENNPNGHNYKFTFKNCKTGIQIVESSYCGIMFTDVTTRNCENGLVLGERANNTVQLINSDIDASKFAVKTDEKSSGKVVITSTKITRGNVYIKGGTLLATNCDFNNPSPQVFFGSAGTGALSGSRFKNTAQIVNNSPYNYIRNDAPVAIDDVPQVPKMEQKALTAAKQTLYVVNKGDGNDIQNKLNQAGNNGGGIVYLPAGHYTVSNPLTVPTGVELKGATDVSTVPHGSGSVLEVKTGEGRDNGQGFITLKSKSGVRGVVINYPDQTISGTTTTVTPKKYPYAIQGDGSEAYVINVGLRACYQGIDFFTNKCDSHYVDYLTGHVFNTGIRIGGGSENGVVRNAQVNVNSFACGRESKYGSWPNSPEEGDGMTGNPALYTYSNQNLDFMVVGDCKNEILYNDFHYGSRKGIIIQSDGNGGPQDMVSIGMGIDGSRISIDFGSGLTGKMDFINTQFVGLGGTEEPHSSYLLAEGNSNFTANLFGSDFWGNPNHGFRMESGTGTLNIHNSSIDNMGASDFITKNGGNLTLNGVTGKNTGNFATGNGGNATVNTSMLEPSNVTARDNIGFSKNISSASNAILNRNGWSATADRSEGGNVPSNAIDGNGSTQWTCGWQAQNGNHWFRLDMGKTNTFNAVLVDVSGAPTDGAAGYRISVSNDGNNWNEVATGRDLQGLIKLGNQSARYIRFDLTETKANFWAIFELYALNIDSTDPTFPAQPAYSEEPETPPVTCDLEPIDASTTAVYAGDSAPIVVTVKNSGEGLPTYTNQKLGASVNVYDASNTLVKTVWSDDHTAASGDLSAFIKPGESVKLTTNGGSNGDGNVTFATAGRYRISVTVNDQGAADCNNDSNAANNTKDFYVTISAKPAEPTTEPTTEPTGPQYDYDFESVSISDVSASAAVINDGDNVYLTVTLMNGKENGGTNDIEVVFSVDGRIIQKVSAQSIKTGERKTIKATMPYHSWFGSHKIKATVTSAGQSKMIAARMSVRDV